MGSGGRIKLTYLVSATKAVIGQQHMQVKPEKSFTITFVEKFLFNGIASCKFRTEGSKS